MIRTFIAFEIEAEARRRAQSLIERLARIGAKVKWVAPDAMHVTLKFLGDVESLQIPEVCNAVAKAAQHFDPIVAHCVGVGAFPNLARPRTVWLGLGDEDERLAALQTAIDDNLRPLGFRKERRKYHPHLTLGRVRAGGAATEQLAERLAELVDFDAGETMVDTVTVYSSELRPEGPLYSVLATLRLGS